MRLNAATDPMLDVALSKTCTRCGEAKPLSKFNKRTDRASGYRSECGPCSKTRTQAWRTSESGMATEATYRADAEKQATIKSNRKSPDKVAEAAARHKRWRDTPEGKVKLAEIARRSQSKPQSKATRAARRKERYRTDVEYNCSVSVRAMLSRILKASGKAKSAKTLEVLGYTVEQFRQRIECQFMPGMDWENRAHHTWHIDHKKPIAAFLAQGITNPKIINALCNLRPMWAADNLSKSAKWPIAANDNKRSAQRAA